MLWVYGRPFGRTLGHNQIFKEIERKSILVRVSEGSSYRESTVLQNKRDISAWSPGF